jgi:Zn-dependent protease
VAGLRANFQDAWLGKFKGVSMALPNIDIGLIIIQFVVFIFSLTLHEVGHAWTSEKFGDPTGRYLGRISLNPVVHIDPIGTILLPLMGMIFNLPLFGWAKPVPVDPRYWRDHVKANIAVSAAGPLANLIIAAVAILIFKAWRFSQLDFGQFNDPTELILFSAIYINVILAVFNMLPIPPLDGSHILSSLLSVYSPDLAESYEGLRPYGFIILIVLLNIGVLRIIYAPIQQFILMLLNV